jgi:hypothetical protein
MTKFWKVALSLFVTVDVFIFGFLGLSQLRFMIFGQGQIPGGGSAIDMAIFLVPIFLAWVAGDRMYYFLNYKERREAARAEAAARQREIIARPPATASVWDDDGWDDEPDANEVKTPETRHSDAKK